MRWLSGLTADLPERLLDRMPAILATGPLSHQAVASAGTTDDGWQTLAVADPGHSWWRGNRLPTLTLRHVGLRASAPLDLATQAVRELLTGHRPGLVWAPASVAASPWGFWQFSNGIRLQFPPGLPNLSAAAGLRPLDQTDATALFDLFRRRSATLDGPGDWPAPVWHGKVAVQDGGWMGYAEDGVLTGALAVHFERREDTVTATVTAWVDVTPAAYASLFGYVAHLCQTCGEVRLESLPPDRPSLDIGDTVSKQRADQDRAWSVRAGDPAVWLPAVTYTGSGEIRLGVVDPLGLWPTGIALRWKDGRLTDWSPSPAGDVTVRIEALMGLCSGQLTATHLSYLGWVDGPADRLASLEAIWHPQPLHRFPWDRP